MKSKYEQYIVSIKILLEDKGKVLILRDENNIIDLPGGRIEKKEAELPFKETLRREITEELGEDVSYILKEPIFYFRVLSRKNKNYILVIVHKAEYLKGDIKLSEEHSSYKWIDKNKVKLVKKDFYKDNIEKYKSFKEYFKN